MDKTWWWQNVRTLKARTHALVEVGTQIGERALASDQARELLTQINALIHLLDHPRAACALLAQTHPSEEVRRTARESHQELLDLLHAFLAQRRLFERLKRAETSALGAEEQRVAAIYLRLCHLHGAERGEQERTHLLELRSLIKGMGALYQRHLSRAPEALSFVHHRELAGMAEGWLERALSVGADGLRVTLSQPNAKALLTYCDDEETRRRVWCALTERGWPDNKPVVQSLLEARRSLAFVFNSPDWASFELAWSALDSPLRLSTFLDALDAAARKAEDHETERLEASLGPGAGLPWNRTWARQKLAQDPSPNSLASIDELKGVFWQLLDRLLGWRVEALDGASIWARHVEVFVLFEGEAEVGRVFLDWLPRVGKAKGMSTLRVRTGAPGLSTPEVAIVASLEPAAGLSHSQVIGLFHELGHVVDHLVGARSTWLSLNGLPSERELAEVTPHVFESWAWQPEVLTRLGWGEHAQRTLMRAERATRGARVRRQLFYARYSLGLHEASRSADLDDFDVACLSAHDPRGVHPERLYAHFPHLVAYGAMYGAYPWALALAHEVLAHESETCPHADRIHAYVERVLRRAPHEGILDAIERLLGRPWGPEACIAWLNEAKNDASL